MYFLGLSRTGQSLCVRCERRCECPFGFTMFMDDSGFGDDVDDPTRSTPASATLVDGLAAASLDGPATYTGATRCDSPGLRHGRVRRARPLLWPGWCPETPRALPAVAVGPRRGHVRRASPCGR